MMETLSVQAWTVPTYQSAFQLRGVRTYEVYRMIDVESFDPNRIMDPVVIDNITYEISTLLGKGKCCSRVLNLGHNAWGIVIWHARNQRCIATYENESPSSQWIIPRGAIFFIVDWNRAFILLSKNSKKEESTDLLCPFSELFTHLQRGAFCRPYTIDFDAVKTLPVHLRHPHSVDQIMWQHLRLKEVLYRSEGSDARYTRHIWEDDAFDTFTFQDEILLSETKEFVLIIENQFLPRPISMRLQNRAYTIKVAINSKTLPVVTKTLEQLFGHILTFAS